MLPGHRIQLPVGTTFHNYVANYGNTNHVGSTCAAPTCVKYLGSPFIGDDQNVHPTGIVTFKKIIDGLSKTMMFSETVQGRNNDLRGYTWWGWSAGFESFASPNASDQDLLQQPQYCVPELYQSALWPSSWGRDEGRCSQPSSRRHKRRDVRRICAICVR